MRRSIVVLSLVVLFGCDAAPKREADTLSDVRALTAGFAGASEGRLSRDDRWLIFRAVPPGERASQMYVAAVRGKGGVEALNPPVRITPNESVNAGGAISPDAASLLFSSTAGSDATTRPTTPRLFRADGWQSALAVVERDLGFDFAQHPITPNDLRTFDATFTPDGKWIVFAGDRDGNVDLYAVKPDGSRLQRLTTAPGRDASPSVSPDGKRVCFSADRAGDGRSQLMLADLRYDDQRVALEKEQALTNNAMANYSAAWHPSGKYLLFTAATPGQLAAGDDLWLIRDDGYRRCRITFAPGYDGLPTFNRDGSQIVWTSNRTPDGTAQLYVARFALPSWVKNPDWKKRG